MTNKNTLSLQSIYISLGSNTGNPQENLCKAVEQIQENTKISIGAISSFYFTEPQGDKDQNWFCNQVMRLDFSQETDCASSSNDLINSIEQKNIKKAYELLEYLQNIENNMGRIRDNARRFGPRIIDLDLIYASNISISTEKLTLPHPRFLERAFVLIPLQEIHSGLILSKSTLQNIVADSFLYNLFQDEEHISIEYALQSLDYRLEGNKIFQG